jgi:hypothetical protein
MSALPRHLLGRRCLPSWGGKKPGRARYRWHPRVCRGACGVPKQSSRGNKGVLPNIIIYTLLCSSDRCRRALLTLRQMRGIEPKKVENGALKRRGSSATCSHTPRRKKTMARSRSLSACGEDDWPSRSRTPKPADPPECEGRVEAEGYRHLPQTRHRALELM